MIDECCTKFLEKELMVSGVHATPRRQVSTWAHVVKATEVSHVRGSLPILSSFA